MDDEGPFVLYRQYHSFDDPAIKELNHWVTHISVSKLIIIGSDKGFSPGRRQVIIWTNVGILFIEPLQTNFSEIYTFSFKKIHLKMLSGNGGHYAVFTLSAGLRPSATKNWAGPASFPFGPASFSSFSCLKIFKDEFRAGKLWNLNAKTVMSLPQCIKASVTWYWTYWTDSKLVPK